MADSLKIIKTSPNSERDKELAQIRNAVPVVSITRIDYMPVSKISPASRNTDFSIENLLRKNHSNDSSPNKCAKSPKVQVTPLTPVRKHEADVTCEVDGDDGTASVSSSIGSNYNSGDADEEYEDVTESRFGPGRKRGRLYDESQDRYRKRSEFLRDQDGQDYGHGKYQMREPNSGDINATSAVAQQLLAQSKYLSPEEKANLSSTFSWLTCTRFKPPKLPRSSKKRAGCKRYGRGPRIPFAPHQIAVLESTFSKSQYLSSDCIHRLADTLHLSETRVKIWFQNRRARYRREKEPQIGHAATIQLQQSHASPHQMRTSFRKSQLLLSTVSPDTIPKLQSSPSAKPSTNDTALENISPFSSSGGSDLQTDLDLQDQQAREIAVQNSRHHPHMLLPNLMPFPMQSHLKYHQQQQQLHDYYLELNQHHGRPVSNGSGNDDGIGISTSPLLHSALQQQSALHYSIHNLSTHHNGGGRGSSSHSPPTGAFMDNYSMQHRQQQEYFHNLLRGSSGLNPFSSPLGAPTPLSHPHGHGMQLPFPPAVKYVEN